MFTAEEIEELKKIYPEVIVGDLKDRVDLYTALAAYNFDKEPSEVTSKERTVIKELSFAEMYGSRRIER